MSRRLTVPYGEGRHFRVIGDSTIYNQNPKRSSHLAYALAKLFRIEEGEKWHLLSDEDYPTNEKQHIITASSNGEKIVLTGYWDEKAKDFLNEESIYFGDILLNPIAWKELPQPWEGD